MAAAAAAAGARYGITVSHPTGIKAATGGTSTTSVIGATSAAIAAANRHWTTASPAAAFTGALGGSAATAGKAIITSAGSTPFPVAASTYAPIIGGSISTSIFTAVVSEATTSCPTCASRILSNSCPAKTCLLLLIYQKQVRTWL